MPALRRAKAPKDSPSPKKRKLLGSIAPWQHSVCVDMSRYERLANGRRGPELPSLKLSRSMRNQGYPTRLEHTVVICSDKMQ